MPKETAGRIDLSEFVEGWIKLLPVGGCGHHFRAFNGRAGRRIESRCGLLRKVAELPRDTAGPLAFWIGSFPRCARCSSLKGSA